MTPFDLSALHAIADEVREHVADGMPSVGRALDAHPAFGLQSKTKSSLVRDLVIHGMSHAAEATGVRVDSSKDTFTLSMANGDQFRSFRILKATKKKDGTYNVPRNGASSWGAARSATFEIFEHWVVGFTMDEETDALEDIFAAPVLDTATGSPGTFVLGDVVLLGSAPIAPTGSFAGSDEDMLPGFDKAGEAGNEEAN